MSREPGSSPGDDTELCYRLAAPPPPLLINLLHEASIPFCCAFSITMPWAHPRAEGAKKEPLRPLAAHYQAAAGRAKRGTSGGWVRRLTIRGTPLTGRQAYQALKNIFKLNSARALRCSGSPYSPCRYWVSKKRLCVKVRRWACVIVQANSQGECV